MKKIISILVGIALLVFVANSYIEKEFFVPNKDFKTDSIFEIKKGESLRSITSRLEEEGYVTSARWMRVLLSSKQKDGELVSGLYQFNQPLNLIQIVEKFSSGRYDLPAVLLTVPEGFTVEQIAERVAKNFSISKEEFLLYASQYEGRLFPETYHFSMTESVQDIVTRMLKEFESRIGNISNEDLVLASIVEGEVQTYEDMRIVAGILKQRIDINMPLQVDVAPETYKERGIPVRPINNPGVNAINAVRDPVSTDYLYYISADDGITHFAKTFEEHKKNIDKYLR